MRKTVLSLAAIFAAASLSAAPADPAALRRYADRAMQKCPGSTVNVERLDQKGPTGFDVYRVSQTSTDKNCAAQSFLLHSPTTQQTFFGTVISLPQDPRPATTRLQSHTSGLLKTEITAKISPLTLGDGLKPATLTKQTPLGPFNYTGYIDSSTNFFLVGMLGKLSEDPTVTLRKALGTENAARRGNGVAKTEIIEISDFQCPTCARAHETLEPLIAKNLNRISYLRLDLPLFEHHEWAMAAALGARAIQRIAPAKYWQYVDHIFKNQTVIGTLNFDKFFKDYVEDHDIDWAAVEKIYKSPAERKALLDQVSRAFAVGVVSTPTIIINGQKMGYGETEYALQAVKETLGGK